MSFVSIHTSTVHVSPVHVNPVHVNPMTTMLPVIVAASARNHHSSHSVPKQTTFCEARPEHIKCEPNYYGSEPLIIASFLCVIIAVIIYMVTKKH